MKGITAQRNLNPIKAGIFTTPSPVMSQKSDIWRTEKVHTFAHNAINGGVTIDETVKGKHFV